VARLIYAAIASLDGYVEDERGNVKRNGCSRPCRPRVRHPLREVGCTQGRGGRFRDSYCPNTSGLDVHEKALSYLASS
jgi:hypothetical protein